MITGGGNGPYYGIKMKSGNQLSIFYIHAILSNPVIEALIKSGSSFFRGNYYSHGKTYIKDVPIRIPNLEDSTERETYEEIVRQVQIHYTTVTRFGQATTPGVKIGLEMQKEQQKREIDRLVNSLYGLTEHDMQLVATLLV